jgi:FkbM family methyltransferase
MSASKDTPLFRIPAPPGGSALRPAGRAPWHFRLAKFLIRHRLRGGYRLIETARRRGWLDALARYPLADGIALDVPLYRKENSWRERDVREYEAEAISLLVESSRQRPGPVTLVDCGADIGVFSVLLAAQCPSLARVIAFEPNPEAFPVLKTNIERLPLAGESHAAAVSDFSGRAELRSPRPGTTGHSQFIVPAPGGDVPVMRVDDLEIDPSHGLLLKIDVEGAELGVLRGTVRALSAAPWFAVLFEAHPRVVQRTGIDPIECVRLLGSLRDCRFQVAEAPGGRLVEDRPFFDQVPEQICNVLCVTDP